MTKHEERVVSAIVGLPHDVQAVQATEDRSGLTMLLVTLVDGRTILYIQNSNDVDEFIASHSYDIVQKPVFGLWKDDQAIFTTNVKHTGIISVSTPDDLSTFMETPYTVKDGEELVSYDDRAKTYTTFSDSVGVSTYHRGTLQSLTPVKDCQTAITELRDEKCTLHGKEYVGDGNDVVYTLKLNPEVVLSLEIASKVRQFNATTISKEVSVKSSLQVLIKDLVQLM